MPLANIIEHIAIFKSLDFFRAFLVSSKKEKTEAY